MRNISFSMTTEAYRNGSKTVSRRTTWRHLKPGTMLMGVEKAQGLKKGEHVKYIHPLRVVSVEAEAVEDIVRIPVRWNNDLNVPAVPEVVKEGFPDMTPRAFVDMFCQANNCSSDTIIRRIEFEHIWSFEIIPGKGKKPSHVKVTA